MSIGLSYLIAVGFLISVTGCIWKIAKEFEPPLRAILFFGFLVRVVFLLEIKPDDQANDWGAHVIYSRMISDGALPRATDCFECYHPPVYHVIAAGFLKPFSRWAMNADVGLQWVSLGFFMLALVGFVTLLRKAIPEKKILYLACGILVFWPRGIPLSVTINNDLSMYLFTAFALSALMTLEKQVHFAAFTALALLSKTNGILLYPLVATHQFFTKQKIKIFTKMNAVLALGLLLSLGFTLYSRRVLTNENVIIGNTDTIPPVYRVGNQLKNFACFDVAAFVKYSDIGLVVDERGRQCFWNFLLKTSLVTEKDVIPSLHRKLSILLSFLLLGVLLISAGGAVLIWRNNRQTAWLFNLNLFWFVAGLIAIRYLKPMGAANDFRYVFPVTPSIATFAAYGTQVFPEKKFFSKITTVVLILFLAVSVAYYTASPFR